MLQSAASNLDRAAVALSRAAMKRQTCRWRANGSRSQLMILEWSSSTAHLRCKMRSRASSWSRSSTMARPTSMKDASRSANGWPDGRPLARWSKMLPAALLRAMPDAGVGLTGRFRRLGWSWQPSGEDLCRRGLPRSLENQDEFRGARLRRVGLFDCRLVSDGVSGECDPCSDGLVNSNRVGPTVGADVDDDAAVIAGAPLDGRR